MLKDNDSKVRDYVQELLSTKIDEADELSGYSQRERKLSAQVLAQTLILGWLGNPKASLNELAQSSQALGVPVSGQALQNRMTDRAVMLLAALLLPACEAGKSSRVCRWAY